MRAPFLIFAPKHRSMILLGEWRGAGVYRNIVASMIIHKHLYTRFMQVMWLGDSGVIKFLRQLETAHPHVAICKLKQSDLFADPMCSNY